MCSKSYIIKELKIKTIKYHYTLNRIAEFQNTDHTKCWQGCGATEMLIHCWWECKTLQPLLKTVWYFFTILNILLLYDHAPWYISKGAENLCPHKNLHTDVYSIFIHNCQNLKATKMSFSR